VDPFRFTIALPTDADWLPLLAELCNHVARIVGLGDRAARQAKKELEEAVRERMRTMAGRGAVEVAFERKAGEDAVSVEVTNSARRFLWDASRNG
jgi:hypothetical protein